MNPEMTVIREVSIQAEDFYEDAVQLGNHAAHALKAAQKTAHRSQMTGLENIAESTLKTSDVFDYIKKQTARFPYWRQGLPEGEYQNVGFGERLKDYLEKNLATRRNSICKKLKISDETDEGKQERRRIYLLLIRQFIRQVVVQYEYQVSIGNQKKES